jgi:ankyrin repeat protein
MDNLPAVVSAIQKGDVEALQQQLSQDPGLAAARIVDARGVGRTLLHIAADWPGHFPNGPQIVAILIAAGADANAAVANARTGAETPLHWAASSDDVAVLDALLDGGADIEAPGAVITGGTAMSDAVVFAQWRAARRLLERGAKTTIWQAAALGLIDRVKQHCASEPPPSAQEITNAFWNACRGGQREMAEYLLDRGANPNWIGHDRKTPLKVAGESGNEDLVQWLRALGAN